MSRKIGDELEDEIAQLLGLRKTANSGAMFNNADMGDYDYIVECKVKNGKKNFHVDNKELNKLKEQAQKRFKDWLYIQKTDGGIQVLVDIELFLKLWKAKHPDHS